LVTARRESSSLGKALYTDTPVTAKKRNRDKNRQETFVDWNGLALLWALWKINTDAHKHSYTWC